MSNDTLLAQTIREYATVKSDTACLRKQLEDAGKNLVLLGEALQRRLTAVSLSEDYISVQAESVGISVGGANLRGPAPIPKDTFDQIIGLLAQYQEAQKQRETLERSLRQYGVGQILEPD